MREATYEFLIKQGLRPELKGFEYVGECVEALKGTNFNLEKEVYPVVAKKLNTTVIGLRSGVQETIKKVCVENKTFGDRWHGYPTAKSVLIDFHYRLQFREGAE